MIALAERFAAEAERLAGTPFRLHGLEAGTGLDCAGLVVLALRNAGGPKADLPPYRLRNLSIAPFARAAQSCGFAETSGLVQRGDLLMVNPGPDQQHLVIALGGGRHIHAHAGLRRTVVHHGLPKGRILAHWRLTQE